MSLDRQPQVVDDETPVLVRGATLAGLAAAARLAKAGHVVVLDTAGLPDGGRWAPHEVEGVEVDDMPQTFLLPAAWRDLFKKSGRPLEAELARHGLALEPAPPQEHLFADGRRLVLPSERGEQFASIEQTLGRGPAERWRDLLDELDEVWQVLRHHGLERPFDPRRLDRHVRARLLSQLTLENLAERVKDPHLATIIRSQASLSCAPPGRAPALLATRLSIHRRFGSWQLVADGIPQRASRMVEVLSQRVDLRGVLRRPEPDEVAVRLEALPSTGPNRLLRPGPKPALAPQVRHHIVEATSEGIVERLDHSAGNPVVTWHRPLGDGRAVETVHDHCTVHHELTWGTSPSSFRAWRSRERLRTDERSWRASSGSHAGHEPWAELLSAALAVYEIHELRTGEDIRPTNRNQPRPRRQALRPGSPLPAGLLKRLGPSAVE